MNNFNFATCIEIVYQMVLLKDFRTEIYDGIVNIYENVHKNGFHKNESSRRTQATVINISSNR